MESYPIFDRLKSQDEIERARRDEWHFRLRDEYEATQTPEQVRRNEELTEEFIAFIEEWKKEFGTSLSRE